MATTHNQSQNQTSDENNKNNSSKDNDNILATNIYMEAPSGISGGTFRSGAWVIRPMNKINGNASVTLDVNTNTFTLAKGAYYINCTVPAYNVGLHQTRLYDVTHNKTVKYGISANASNGCNSLSTVNYFTGKLKVSTKFRLEHMCQNTQNNNGFGIVSGFPSNEAQPHFENYGDMEILQIA